MYRLSTAAEPMTVGLMDDELEDDTGLPGRRRVLTNFSEEEKELILEFLQRHPGQGLSTHRASQEGLTLHPCRFHDGFAHFWKHVADGCFTAPQRIGE